MLQKPIQTNREIAAFTPFGERVALRSFRGRESISELFEYHLELLSGDAELSPQRIVGHNVTFTLRLSDGMPRYFNGCVAGFSLVHQDRNATTYHATIVPWLWFLTQTTDCRIFQARTVPEIIEQVCIDLGFDDFRFELTQEYQTREYCVQYRETDFAFVSRLMEEEGLFYWFDHENGSHTLVIGDSHASYAPMDECDVDFGDPNGCGDLGDQIMAWEHHYRFHSGAVANRDFNFQMPRADLTAGATTTTGLNNIEVYEAYDYPGNFGDKEVARRRTNVRMQSEEAKYDTVSGSGNYRTFRVGGTFRVISHVSQIEAGQEYFVTRVEHAASVDGTYVTGTGNAEVNYKNEFSAMPAATIFRPLRQTPRPVLQGIQTATVVGPASEEIFTDPFGRVKVQFPWDREGLHDERSSCWMRVSQVHAGHGWGHMDLPRIGEEVVVGFLDGNPDRPIIKGRVYNGNNRPPFKLPEQKTRSEGKTDTYMGSGFNEMSSDDTPGQEQLRVNAQHNMDSNVNNSQTLTVGVDRSEDIGNNETLLIGVDALEEIGNDKSSAVGNDQDIEVANDIEIVAATSITLACGASTIHMNQAGVITISGQFITSAASATHTTVAPLTEVAGGKMLTQAAPICIDIGGIKHIKGKETSIAGSSVQIKGDQIVIQGAPIALGDAGAPIAQIPGPTPTPPSPSPQPPTAPNGGSSNQSGDPNSVNGNADQSPVNDDATTGPDQDRSNETPTPGSSVKECRGPEDLASRRDEIRSQLENDSTLTPEQRDALYDEHADLEREIAKAGCPEDSKPDEPPKVETPKVEMPKDTKLTPEQIEELKRDALRDDRKAELLERSDLDEQAAELRKESERKKLEAAYAEEGEKGRADKQKQIDAANASRDLIDVIEKGEDLLPPPVKKIAEWAKYPIRDGIPQVVEKAIEIEQDMNDWLKKKANENPAIREKVQQTRDALRRWLDNQ